MDDKSPAGVQAQSGRAAPVLLPGGAQHQHPPFAHQLGHPLLLPHVRPPLPHRHLHLEHHHHGLRPQQHHLPHHAGLLPHLALLLPRPPGLYDQWARALGPGLPHLQQVLLQLCSLKYYIEIVYEIAFCVELPITLIFWGFLFKLILEMDVTLEVIIVNANLHAGPLIVLCVDTIYNSFSFPSQHFHAVLLFGFLYGVVNLSYSLAAHIIYQPIDWVSILSYALMIGAVALTFLMHWLGRYIYRKFKKEKM